MGNRLLLFDFTGIFNWKLTSMFEIVQFVLLLAFVITVLTVAGIIIAKRRTRKFSNRKIARRAQRHLPKGRARKIYLNPTFTYGDKSRNFDVLAVGEFGIVFFVNIPIGHEAFGEPRSEVWKISNEYGSIIIPNPLLRIEDSMPIIQSYLAANDIFNIPYDTVTVFTDTYTTPTLFLGPVKNLLVLKEIRAYCKYRKEHMPELKDPARLIEVLDKAITVSADPPPEEVEMPSFKSFRARQKEANRIRKERSRAARAARKANKSKK